MLRQRPSRLPLPRPARPGGRPADPNRKGGVAPATLSIVDREEGGAAALAARGYPLKAVFTRAQLIGEG